MKKIIFDIKGSDTGQPISIKRLIWIIIPVVAYIICLFIPMPEEMTENSPKMLGAIVVAVLLWSSGQFEMYVGSFVFVLLSVLTGCVTFNDVGTVFGNSAFLAMVGMFIVAMGAVTTNISKRLGYLFLSKFGKKPGKIVLSLGVATMIISSCCSNLAVTVVMASIAVGILKEIGEEPGTSKFGRLFILTIPAFSTLGGIMLINGAPGPSNMALNALHAATNGEVTFSYAQWATIGVITAILLVAPIFLVYKCCLGGDKIGYNIEPQIFKKKLNDLGPLSGAEIRWVITVLAMIVCFLLNKWVMGTVALLFGLITVAPVVGTVEPKHAISHLPWSVLIMSSLVGLVGYMFNSSGMGAWLGKIMTPHLTEMSPLVMMIIVGVIFTVINNILCNVNIGLIVVFITAFSPVILSCGLNPAFILAPIMMTSCCTLALGAQSSMVITFDYGYWKMKDTLLPGFIISLLTVVVSCIVLWFVGPLVGINAIMQ